MIGADGAPIERRRQSGPVDVPTGFKSGRACCRCTVKEPRSAETAGASGIQPHKLLVPGQPPRRGLQARPRQDLY